MFIMPSLSVCDSSCELKIRRIAWWILMRWSRSVTTTVFTRPNSFGLALGFDRARVWRAKIRSVASVPKNDSNKALSSSESWNSAAVTCLAAGASFSPEAAGSTVLSAIGDSDLDSASLVLVPSVGEVGGFKFRRCKTSPDGRISLTRKSVYLRQKRVNLICSISGLSCTSSSEFRKSPGCLH